MSAPLPWQTELWARVAQRQSAHTLPHALLLTGPVGVGKNTFAQALAQTLLCEQPQADGHACGRCRPCHLYSVGSHPDLRRLAPAEEGSSIGIDAVRDLAGFVSLRPQFGRYKIALIAPAEALTVAAANALLKTLEEPTPATLLILVTNQWGRLLATVRSRCQRIVFPVPPTAIALEWLHAQLPGAQTQDTAALLALAGGAPLQALELGRGDTLSRRQALFEGLQAMAAGQSSPLALAETWSKFDIARVAAWQYDWLADMVRLRSTPCPPWLSDTPRTEDLRHLAQGLNLSRLHRELERLADAGRRARAPLNAQLFLEDLFIGWVQCFKPRTGA